MAQQDIKGLLPEQAFTDIDRGIEGLRQMLSVAKEISTVSRDIRFNVVGDKSTLVQMTDGVNQVNKATAEYVKQLKEAQAAQKAFAQEQKNKIALDKAEGKELLELQKYVQDLEKAKKKLEEQVKREEKQIEALTDEYKLQSKALTELDSRFKNLALTHGRNHPLTKQAEEDAKRLRQTLYELDAAVGDHRRNVGNYNSVAASMGQVLRELPNAALGWKTFIISLSNNLTPLIEDIGELVAKNRALAAQGKATTPVLETLGNSMFSLTGIASIAITVFTLLGTQIFDAGKEAEQAKQKIDVLSKSIDDQIQKQLEYEEGLANAYDQGANALRRKAELLKASGADEKKIMEANNALHDYEIDQLNKKAALYDKVQSAFINNKGRNLDWFALPEISTEMRGEIEKILESGEDLGEHMLRQQAEIQEKIKDLKGKKDQESANYERRLREKALQEHEKEERKKAALEEALREATLQYRQEQSEALKKELSDLAKAIDDNPALKKLLQDYQNRADGITGLQASEQATNAALYKDGAYGYEVYEQKKTEINERYSRERLANEIKYYREILALSNLDFNERSKYDQLLAKSEVELAELGIATEKKRLDAAKKTAQERVKIEADAAERRMRIEKQVAENMERLGNELVQSAMTVYRGRTESELREIDRQIEALNRKKEADINAVNSSALNEEQKRNKIAGINASNAAKEEALRTRSEARQKEMAQLERRIAIGKITIETAVAVARALGNAPYTPANFALAAQTAAIGAAQIAAIMAVPAYAKGTPKKGHPEDGFALVGEGKHDEAIFDKNWNLLGVTDGPSIEYMKKGTHVVPMPDLAKIAAMQGFLVPNLLQNDKQQQRENMKPLFNDLKSALRHDMQVQNEILRQVASNGNVIVKDSGNLTTHLYKHVFK